jgi:hypothetical protein
VDFEFVTNCVTCGKSFRILWAIDRLRVGPESVAKITCPACKVRFYQKFSDLVPFKPVGPGFLTGRPVRTMELIYDCPSCGMRGISVTLMHTDMSWEDLAKETIQTAVCNNAKCVRMGREQKIVLGATRLGMVNSAWS